MDNKPNQNLLILLGEWWEKTRSRPKRVYRWSSWLPSRGNVLFTLVMVGFLILTQSVWARGALSTSGTSTNTISYQGRLADTGGSPITGLQNMEFRLYNVPIGGTPLWEEFWTGGNAVQVSDGLFNVMLGSLDTTLTTVVQGETQLYLGITIDTDSEMLPRVQLGSVPFSMQALTVPDDSIVTAKIADQAVTNQKQTITSYYRQDGTYIEAVGTTWTEVSRFTIDNVPAGDLNIVCTFVASVPTGASNYGSVRLSLLDGTFINQVPTHGMIDLFDDQTIHGHVTNFSGGQLNLQLLVVGENDNVQINFGVPTGEPRFARKCTILAGL